MQETYRIKNGFEVPIEMFLKLLQNCNSKGVMKDRYCFQMHEKKSKGNSHTKSRPPEDITFNFYYDCKSNASNYATSFCSVIYSVLLITFMVFLIALENFHFTFKRYLCILEKLELWLTKFS